MTNEDKLRAFAQEVVAECWSQDGPDIEGMALKHGLLIELKVAAPCNDQPGECACVDEGINFPTICNRKTPLLTGKP